MARPRLGKDRGQVAGFFDGRTGGDLDGDAHLVRHHMGEGSLAQPRRTVKQHVIQRFAAFLCRGEQDRQVFTDLVLTGDLREPFGPQCLVDAVVADPRRGIDKSFFFHTLIICQILSFPCFFIFGEY